MAIWPSRNISDCSHFLILVSIRTVLLTNIKFGEGWFFPILHYSQQIYFDTLLCKTYCTVARATWCGIIVLKPGKVKVSRILPTTFFLQLLRGAQVGAGPRILFIITEYSSSLLLVLTTPRT